jgi:hypothetical protein
MAGTVTIISSEYFGRYRSVLIKCVSDASGDANGVEITDQGGVLASIAYLPVAGCSDEWDLTITMTYTMPDGTSITWADITNGDGADLSNSTDGAPVNMSSPFTILPGSKLTPIVANLGNAKTVYIVMNIWEEIS